MTHFKRVHNPPVCFIIWTYYLPVSSMWLDIDYWTGKHDLLDEIMLMHALNNAYLHEAIFAWYTVLLLLFQYWTGQWIGHHMIWMHAWSMIFPMQEARTCDSCFTGYKTSNWKHLGSCTIDWTNTIVEPTQNQYLPFELVICMSCIEYHI